MSAACHHIVCHINSRAGWKRAGPGVGSRAPRRAEVGGAFPPGGRRPAAEGGPEPDRAIAGGAGSGPSPFTCAPRSADRELTGRGRAPLLGCPRGPPAGRHRLRMLVSPGRRDRVPLPAHDAPGPTVFDLPGDPNTGDPFTDVAVALSVGGVAYFVYRRGRPELRPIFAAGVALLVANPASLGMITCHEQGWAGRTPGPPADTREPASGSTPTGARPASSAGPSWARCGCSRSCRGPGVEPAGRIARRRGLRDRLRAVVPAGPVGPRAGGCARRRLPCHHPGRPAARPGGRRAPPRRPSRGVGGRCAGTCVAPDPSGGPGPPVRSRRRRRGGEAFGTDRARGLGAPGATARSNDRARNVGQAFAALVRKIF